MASTIIDPSFSHKGLYGTQVLASPFPLGRARGTFPGGTKVPVSRAFKKKVLYTLKLSTPATFESIRGVTKPKLVPIEGASTKNHVAKSSEPQALSPDGFQGGQRGEPSLHVAFMSDEKTIG